MRLSVMLAKECIFIVISLISCIPKLRDGLNEHNRATEYTLGFLPLSRLCKCGKNF